MVVSNMITCIELIAQKNKWIKHIYIYIYIHSAGRVKYFNLKFLILINILFLRFANIKLPDRCDSRYL